MLTSTAASNLENYRRNNILSCISLLSHHVPLTPLAPHSIRTIMESCIGHQLLVTNPNILSAENITQLQDRALGSPLHAIVLASGIKKAVTEGKFTGIQDLPTGAHNIILARFDQLSHSDQVILKIGSVFGMKFSFDSLRHVLLRMQIMLPCAVNAGVDDGDITAECRNTNHNSPLHEALARITSANLLYIEVNDHSAEHNHLYAFPDHSAQDSIYNLMLSKLRGTVHGYIAEYLESNLEDVMVRYNDIAHHYIMSNNLDKKVEYLKFAA
jgi:hypothetical protein